MSRQMPRSKVSISISDDIIREVDELVRQGAFDSRSAAFERATKELLRSRIDALIEAEVAKLDRPSEMLDADEGMDDFIELARE
jgi:Arc/MetJ-type ribon-helix-helix transcriptional regulator